MSPAHIGRGRRRSVGRSWTAGLVMAFTGLAQAGEALCSGGQCGATALSPTLLREAMRTRAPDTRLTPQLAPARPPAPAGDDTATWERRLGAANGREDYDCALSFGVGASLAGERFLATRLLGRTKVWRDGAKR